MNRPLKLNLTLVRYLTGFQITLKAKSVLNRAALKAMTKPTVNQTRLIDLIRKSD